MANPTTNFGWVMPTSTDLVTDLPADFAVFGQAVDTSMADLKGGTTGQILAKATNTDMDFTWVTNDVGDITAVTAGTGISGGGTSGAVTITNSMATEIAAKGDLIVGTGAATFDNLTAGANGETLVADSSTSTGLRYQATQAAGKNAIINGGFDIWQRGTSFGSLTDGGFFADRWAVDFNGTGATRTVSRQEIAGAWATSSRYFMRYAQSVAGTGGTYNWFHTRIEGVATYAGQTVTVSFMAKADASRSVDVAISQVFGGGGSSQVNYNFGTAALTTSWQRFTYNVALTSISGKTIGTNDNLELDFKMPLNTAMTIDVGDIQLEVGSVATQFTRTGGTIQGELAACQRYYYRASAGSQAYARFGIARASSTTNLEFCLVLPSTMRVAPTAVEFSTLTTTNAQNVSAAALNSPSQNSASIDLTVGSATANQPYTIMANNSTSAYVAVTAEL